MKILQINTVYPSGSTGRIMQGIYGICKEKDIECVVAYRYTDGEELQDTKTISSWLDCHIHNRIAQVTTLGGCFSGIKTHRFLRWVESYKPDIVHIHNVHGNYINLSGLFKHLKKKNIPIVWTLHDCWAFTGGCPYFTLAKCDKWKNGCSQCPKFSEDKSCLIDLSKVMWKKKKKWFSQVPNMTLVTPSMWLENLLESSFLKEYPRKTIYNGIDLSVFKPTETNFREEKSIPKDKFVILGVAFDWGVRKGLDVFIELAERLDKKLFQIVLVGVDKETEKSLPDSIICISRTKDQKELAGIYSASDLFVNPTREETLGLVNIEANACGIPVVTFKTDGSPECICEKSGAVVEYDNIDALLSEIIHIYNTRPYKVEDCIERAKCFDKNKRFEEYIDLYYELVHKNSEKQSCK